jgi:hypothetical protein
MTDDAKRPSTPLDNFTRAVKTIVGVPKSAVSKKGDAVNEKLSKYGDIYTCPDCGAKKLVVRGRKHNHKRGSL